MTNCEIDSAFENLQTLRDNTGDKSKNIINQMLTHFRELQKYCYQLSNQEDVYKK